MKITLKQFYEDFPVYKACIHCKTEEQAEKLTQAFHKMGKRWNGGMSYLRETNWEGHYEDTVYYNSNQYGSIQYARSESEVVIIEFEDVILDEYVEKLKELIRSIK